MYPIYFNYVWTTFEHQVQNLYASQKVQVFSSPLRPETHFRHEQDHQRAVALQGSINVIQNTIITVYEIESQRQLTQIFENGLIRFQK